MHARRDLVERCEERKIMKLTDPEIIAALEAGKRIRSRAFSNPHFYLRKSKQKNSNVIFKCCRADRCYERYVPTIQELRDNTWEIIDRPDVEFGEGIELRCYTPEVKA